MAMKIVATNEPQNAYLGSLQAFIASVKARPTIQWPTDSAIREAVLTRSLATTRAIRFLLQEYDASLPGDKVLSEPQIEHVLPQSWETDGAWATLFTKEQHTRLKDVWANLLPLSQPLNSSLQRSAYAEKRSRYCSHFRELFAIACAILEGRPNSDGSVDTSDEELFRKLAFDPDGVLPPGHYLSARLVAQLDDSPRISRGEILQLCIEPERLFSLYNRDPIANDLVFPIERASTP